MVLLIMPAVGSCLAAADGQAEAGGGPIAITKPVGAGPLARNLAADVKIIQEALNRVTVAGLVGGPIPFLKVDGFIGPKTNAAILNFQKQQVKAIHADGLVEPIKKTILRLNELVAPLSKIDLNGKLAFALPIVRAGLAAALANLTAIIAGGPAASGPAAIAADRLNRHFRMDTLQATAQGDARINLFETYQDMALVLNDPQLFNFIGALDAFDVDPQLGKIALVNTKGAFAPILDEKGNDNKVRHIRLGLGFFAPAVTPEFAAFILTHELSHFTSRRDGVDIKDHGRGWFDDTFIRPLPAAKRLANADSYATFAQECRANSAAKPPFVVTAPGGLGGAR